MARVEMHKRTWEKTEEKQRWGCLPVELNMKEIMPMKNVNIE
jgi:hypothetical protein